MGSLLITIVVNLTQYLILIFLMQYICSAHMDLSRKHLLICAGMSVLLDTLAFYSNNENLQFAVMFVMIALTVLLFSRKKGIDLLLFFPALAIYSILTVVPEAAISELWPALEGEFILWGTTLRIDGIASDILLLTLLLVLRHFLQKYELSIRFSVKEIFGSIGLLFFSLIDGLLLVNISRINPRPSAYYIWVIIFIGAFLLGVGYYLYELIDSRIRIYRKSLKWNETEYLRLQLEALQENKENEEQFKRMRHDLKNHLAVIQTLCDEGNYDEVKKYTRQLNTGLPFSLGHMLTGNKVADLVLHSKMQLAEKNDIAFTFSGSLSSLDKLDAPDICGLLSNAYDNALEACQSQENAYIHTKASVTRNYTVILITNSVSNRKNIQGDRIPTTKKDAASHGFGTAIMKQIAQKYGGSCSFHCTDKEFQVKIVLLT